MLYLKIRQAFSLFQKFKSNFAFPLAFSAETIVAHLLRAPSWPNQFASLPSFQLSQTPRPNHQVASSTSPRPARQLRRSPLECDRRPPFPPPHAPITSTLYPRVTLPHQSPFVAAFYRANGEREHAPSSSRRGRHFLAVLFTPFSSVLKLLTVSYSSLARPRSIFMQNRASRSLFSREHKLRS